MDRLQVEAYLEPLLSQHASVTEKFDVRVSPDYTMIVGADIPKTGMVLTKDARDRIFSLAGISKKTVGRLSMNTANNALTELLRQEGDLMLLHDNQYIQDILPVQRLRPVDSKSMLDTLQETIPDHAFHRVMRIGQHSIQIESVGSHVVEDDIGKKGSLVQAGVVTRFSPLGLDAPEVQNFVVRLVCVNGMTSTEFFNKYTTGPLAEVIPWYQQSLIRAYAGMDGLLGKWNNLAEEHLTTAERVLLLNGLLKAARVSHAETEIIHNEAMQNPPETSYEVLQLITWAASHVIEEPLAILRAQEAASSFVDAQQHAMWCPTCKRKQ